MKSAMPLYVTIDGVLFSMFCGATLGAGKYLFSDDFDEYDEDNKKNTESVFLEDDDEDNKNNNNNKKRHKEKINHAMLCRRVMGGALFNLGIYLVVPNFVRLWWLWPGEPERGTKRV